jgi:hypothetical protein
MVSVAGSATEKAARTSSDGRGSAGELKHGTSHRTDGTSDFIYMIILEVISTHYFALVVLVGAS